MWLEAKEIEEVAKKVASRQPESSLKMSQENDSFVGFGSRDDFCPGSAADYFGGNSVRSDELVKIGLADVRALPAA